jgi:hypothetical protein
MLADSLMLTVDWWFDVTTGISGFKKKKKIP